MTATPADALTKSLKSTTTRPGNPPRWLVVALLLAIVGGVVTQGVQPGTPGFKAPMSQELGIEKVIPLVSQPPVHQSIPSLQHALAFDPSTNRFWVAIASNGSMQQRLDIYACLDGGKTLQSPVDVQALLPQINDMAALTCAPDGTLYLAFLGTDTNQGQQAGVLRSRDVGVTWEHWWTRPDDGYLIDDQSFQLISWNDRTLLLYGAMRSGAPSGYFTEDIASSAPEDKPHFIAPSPAGGSTNRLQGVLATQEALHLLIQTGDYTSGYHLWTGGITADDALLPLQELHVQKGHRLVCATMLQDASGLPIVLLKLDTPMPGIIKLFSKAHAATQVSDPKVSTLRYEWDTTQQRWQPCPKRPGPAIFMKMQSPASGWLVSSLVRNNSTDQGLFIDALASDGTWSERYELLGAANTWYDVRESLQLNDGRLVILASASPLGSYQRRDIFLVTDPLPKLEATAEAPP